MPGLKKEKIKRMIEAALLKKGVQDLKRDNFRSKLDSMINKKRADGAIMDSVKQKFVNDKYIKAMKQLTQEKDSLLKKHRVDIAQLQKKHAIDSARNQNLPNRKQSGPASTPKRGGGEVK